MIVPDRSLFWHRSVRGSGTTWRRPPRTSRLRSTPSGMRGSRASPADVSHWLLVRGTGERPLPERVGPDSLRAHSSTRRPAVQRGDLAVCYASVWQVIFAVVEVVSDPENEPGRDRWG